MFLDILICEFLKQNGELDTLMFKPRAGTWGSSVVVDHRYDIDPRFKRPGSFDMGPFRIYAQGEYCDVHQLRTRLDASRFRCSSDRQHIEFSIEHLGIPVGSIKESRHGYYSVVFPQGYSLTDLHVLDPYRVGHEFERHVLWDTKRQRHVVQVELRSGRGSFSFSLSAQLRRSDGSNSFQSTDRTVEDVVDELGWGAWQGVPNVIRSSEKSGRRVFLCHSSLDKPFCRKLTNDLVFEGIGVWIDEAEMKVGDSLFGKIQQAIDETDFLVAVLSANSLKSRWCQEELRQAMAGQLADGRVVVLPVVLDSSPLPGFLREKLYADFRDWEADEAIYSTGFERLVKSITSQS